MPIDAGMRRIIEKLLQGEEVEYGFLGVVFDYSVPAEKGGGVRIKNVLPGGPAAQARVRDGDVVVRVNGTELRDMDDLFLAIGTQLAGNTIVLDVRRPSGAMERLSVTLAKYYVPESLGKPVVTRKPPAPAGLRVDYTSILAQQRRAIDAWGRAVPAGVMIREIQANSAAEEARLQAGKVITQVAGKDVTTPKEFYEAMEAALRGGRRSVELTLLTADGRPDKVKIELR